MLALYKVKYKDPSDATHVVTVVAKDANEAVDKAATEEKDTITVKQVSVISVITIV